MARKSFNTEDAENTEDPEKKQEKGVYDAKKVS